MNVKSVAHVHIPTDERILNSNETSLSVFNLDDFTNCIE